METLLIRGKISRNFEIYNLKNMYYVKGNGEDQVLYAYNKFILTEEIKKEYKWILNVSDDDMKFIKNLPFTISIPKYKCVIVYARLVPNVLPSKETCYVKSISGETFSSKKINKI